MSQPRIYVAEPPAAYRLHKPVVADCSVLAALVFMEPQAAEAKALIAGCALHAPDLLAHEIGNVAVNKLRRKADAEVVQDGLTAFQLLPLQLHAASLPAQVALAQRYGLSAYDAAYLWLAAELKLPLLTFDRRLGLAAQEHLSGLDEGEA